MTTTSDKCREELPLHTQVVNAMIRYPDWDINNMAAAAIDVCQNHQASSTISPEQLEELSLAMLNAWAAKYNENPEDYSEETCLLEAKAALDHLGITVREK